MFVCFILFLIVFLLSSIPSFFLLFFLRVCFYVCVNLCVCVCVCVRERDDLIVSLFLDPASGIVTQDVLPHLIVDEDQASVRQSWQPPVQPIKEFNRQ